MTKLTKSTLGLYFLFAAMYAHGQTVETVVQTGHYASVTAVACNSSNTLIATGSADKTIKLWRAADGKEIRTLTGSNSEITSIDFSKQNNLLLGVNANGIIILWNIETGEIVRQLQSETEKYTCAAFHPSEPVLATGSKKSGVEIWDLNTGNKLSQLKTDSFEIYRGNICFFEDIRSVSYSADGKFILAGANNITAIVWESKTGKELGKYRLEKNTCPSCPPLTKFSTDAKLIFSAYSDTLKVFERESGKLIKRFHNKRGTFDDIAVSPDGKYVAAIEYGYVEYWDLASGKLIFQTKDNNTRATALCFSEDSKYLIIGNEKRVTEIRSLTDGEKVLELKGFLNDMDARILEYSYMYWAAMIKDTKLSPDGKYIAVGQTGNEARLIDFKTGKTHKILAGHTKMVLALGFSKNGEYLATGGIDGKAIVWNVETGSKVNTFNYKDSSLAIFSVDISPDNKLLATSDWAGNIVIWDIQTAKRLRTLTPHNGSTAYQIKFSTNGLYIISAGLDRKLKLIEIDTGEEIKTFTGHTGLVTSIQNHPSLDQFITAGMDNTIRVWDFYSGLQIKKINAHEDGTYAACFDRSGKYIISGGNDNKAKLWDANNLHLLAEFTGHTGGVGDVNITPDLKYVLTGGRDGTVRIWNIETKKELVSMVFLRNNDWFVKTPKGYFDATEGAFKSIAFVKGTTLYSIDQFFTEFYRPNLYRDAVFNDSTAFRENLFHTLETFPPPTVEIIAPEQGTSTDNGMATFMVKVTNNGGGIKEFKVLQNGKRQIIDDSDLKRMKKADQYVMKTFDLKLVPGENNFTLSAINEGEIESVAAKTKITYKGTPKSANIYVFSIGINKYANASMNLNFARSDAESVTKILKDKTSNLFKNIYTYTLVDEQASREKILGTFDQISRVINKEDVFVFFYAGHGSVNEGTFYFIPAECTGLYQQEKLNMAISVKELQEKFKAINALKQVVFIDACHSGSSVDMLAMRGAQEEKALAQLSRSSGIHVMASSESQQQSAEIKSLGHGVFTYTLLEALKGGADGAPKDTKVTVYELKSYIDDQVPETSYKLIQHKQFPSTFSIGHDFPLVMD
ncbi:MAG TPA: caspase family protein [Bacteroidales bacterium]|nr:caspase family protein [Bacteroidales bacterium]